MMDFRSFTVRALYLLVSGVLLAALLSVTTNETE